MLVSPLMGPILSLTFGTAVLKSSIIMRGLRNEVIGVVISVIVGLVCGFCLYGISGTDFIPGDEILNRGKGEEHDRQHSFKICIYSFIQSHVALLYYG